MNAATLLVFARCAGFVSRAPGLSHPSVPRPLRALFAVALAASIAPASQQAMTSGVAVALACVTEVLLGAAMGLAASALYDGAYAGGRAIDDYVGVKAIAPNVALVAPSGFGRLWSLAFTTGYFVLGGYRLALAAFAESFERLPLGAPLDPHAWYAFAVQLVTTVAGVGLAVAGPAIAIAFLTQVALAALSRTIPRFASLSLSFPLVFAAVLLVTVLSLPLVALRAATPLWFAP